MADHFDARTDALLAAIDKLSLEVSEGLAEQATFTGEAYVKFDTKMDAGFARIERKLDQFIDTQIQTNQIVDRRLRLVEG